MFKIQYLSDIARRPTTIYIIVNIFISSVGFLRSFIFMRWLNMEELGLISLSQTVMQFISLFQLGLINGGYRLFALDKNDDQKKVNNLLFTYFALLFGTCMTIWMIVALSGHKLIMDNWLLLISIVCGILMLINNWLNNTLIGRQLLSSINKINIISGLVSVSLLPIVYYSGFVGAVIVIISQPLLFVVITLVKNKELRPDSFFIDLSLSKYILSFGFIPFLVGIFVILNIQIERWSIAANLGAEALGCFYLVFLYNSLFLLVPNSILNIFFPRAVSFYDRGDMNGFTSVVKKQLMVMLMYDLIIVGLTFSLFEPVVGFLFPSHSNNVRYVYYFIPGLLAMSLTEVNSVILNASVRLKPILISGLLSVSCNIFLVLISIYTNTMTLKYMAIVKSITLIVPFVYCFVYIMRNWNKILKGYEHKRIN